LLLKSGYGIQKYWEGAVYKGYWQNGKFNGKGVFTYPPAYIADKYEGNFKVHIVIGVANKEKEWFND